MVVYIEMDGNVKILSPENLYQGSTTNRVTLITPFPSTTAVGVGFILPDGTTVTDSSGSNYFPMELLNTETSAGVTATAYEYVLPFTVLEQYGELKIAFKATFTNGNQTSYLATVEVQESILPTPPENPDEDTYQLLLKYLETLQSDYINLDNRVERLEAVTVGKTMTDVKVVNESGTLYITKYYSDGTTAVTTTPAGSGSIGTAKGITILTFSAESWTNIAGLGETPIYELAFTAQNTGADSADYIVEIDVPQNYTYEHNETTPTAQEGYEGILSGYFKGSDGSLLLTQVNTPFAGRALIFTGDVPDSTAIQNAVQEAVDTANEAKNAANSADLTAQSANARSERALSTAEKIDGKATQALTNSASAVSSASAAQTAAEAAQSAAEQAAQAAQEALQSHPAQSVTITPEQWTANGNAFTATVAPTLEAGQTYPDVQSVSVFIGNERITNIDVALTNAQTRTYTITAKPKPTANAVIIFNF